MTYERIPLSESPVLRNAGEYERRRHGVSIFFAALRAATAPPDPRVEAFRQMFADTIRQQERRR